MKCKKCGKRAVEKLKPYGIALCRDCYVEFYEGLVERSFKKFGIVKRGEKVLACVSGGKDSSAMLGVLSRLSEKLDFEVEALHIDLGIGEYSKKSMKTVEELCGVLGIKLHVISVAEFGFTIDDIPKKTCSACGIVKRYLMNRYARLNGFDVVATGHTAEDIISFFFKNWLSGNFSWSEKLLPRTESFDERIVTRIRPLYDRSEKENLLYVICRGLPFLLDDCPHAPRDEWKEIVYYIESRKPGFRRNFVLNLAKYLEERVHGTVEVEEKEEYGYCKLCGEVTTFDVCAFCRLVKKFSAKP
ncbi:ATP-binding protein [Archaeoglobus veneficus]|uniref:PP-loop domain protein n=1 Tax=Archaeoglobus veneficus (strain DSM 11195 / SNP6) TaxID=693661 RepID=F2KQG7_ARCVS|nr:ATP-binding protein [Archaeoglobus veneficus]AEA47700.1 PP-loop domain protein [Archaeoglobus veneficus SNP6]